MDEGLRPRDIQARIRAGQSSEQIAAATGMPVEKVARFEAPVLAERAHVADKARMTVRHGDGGRTIDDVVTAVLRERGVDPDTMVWDSWRRDDGRWAVSLVYGTGDSERSGRFTYDIVARAVLPDDEASRSLLDPSLAPDERPRLMSVPTPPRADQVFDHEQVATEPEPLAAEPAPEQSELVPTTVTTFDPDESPSLDDEEQAAAAPDAPEPRPAPSPAPKPAAKPARGKRASVPSWDEILFGGPDSE